ncbi:MAG TPA: redoxin domain-containing protein [Saprospiraceae bacterium]|nr:redoxin domain-containing protein [Saprospiraceae bacterium]
MESMHILPEVGDLAPVFEVDTEKGVLRFPEYCQGSWCIFFAHPANFTSAWTMFSAFLAMKERWLNERNTKVLALSNESLRQNNQWADKARRYIGIYLKAPVIEDLDFRIAKQFGLASGRRPQPGCDRLALIIDPQGIVRMIIHRPLPNIESALLEIEMELDRLQGKIDNCQEPVAPVSVHVPELSDAISNSYKADPAYFTRKKINPN